MTTLTALRDRVEQALEDTTNLKWSTGEIDEAIRLALDAYSEHLPHRAIEPILLVAAGREIDISALTYRTIERVWWDYDAADPTHPPAWRDFEIWPGDILHLNTAAEPAIGDTVRVWYTTAHTLNGLDAAAATTFPSWHTSTLVIGATAHAVLHRDLTVIEQANVNTWAGRNLREWAELQLARYTSALQDLARLAASLASGTATAPALDRWDGGGW